MGMLKNKSEYLRHINDKDQIIVMRKILDKVESVMANRDTVCTEFLDPYQRKLALSIINRFNNIACHEDGGYEDTERKVLVIYPSYLDKYYVQDFVQPLQITIKGNDNEVSHRDCLGALLSLGLKRDKVGDIFVLDGLIYVFLHIDICDYVQYNLNKIKNVSVLVEYADKNSLDIAENDDTDDIVVNTSSMRLDSVISAVYNVSRSESAKFVKGGLVKVNFQPIEQLSHSLNEGDLISVRKKGRVKIQQVLGETRKGRIRLKMKKYL